ncbi:MAG: glucose-6-phosphate isomerase [Bacteroidales bacterium]|nr:glucose-6-phosphate isomerase [Bacteroidales bacterium]
MEALKIDISKVYGFVPKTDIYNLSAKATESAQALEKKTGKGNDFLGWVHLPSSISDTDIKDIEKTAAKIKKHVDAVVVIGIGGSYLGTRAVAETLSPTFMHLKPGRKNPVILYAGHNIGEDYLNELTELLNDMKYAIVVISKSGTTTEPAIAFRILKKHLEKKVGKEAAKDLIVAITDAKKGALLTTARQEGYKTYVIPDDVGGRYSVLTPVGLVPLAIGGFDIRALVKGAIDMEKITASSTGFENNPACLYAAARTMLYRSGKRIEILANFENKLHYLAEWWKQLYGESEGKEGKGIFPASVDFSADLHSMGQYIQEGERLLIETMISVTQPATKLVIPKEKNDLDGLNYIAGKRVDSVNKMAELGTMLAHVDGGVPNIRIELPKLNEYYLGQLMYFFEKACGISGYLLGVNPFDQPGVEAYKKNMFALLEKPGFEEESKKIKSRI